MKITPLDIRRKEFKRSVRGYSDEEVDIFLDEVADEFERIFQENMELQDRSQRLDEQIAGHTQLKDALEKTLISAQLQSEEIRANAHKESELILRDAEMKARGIVSESYSETQRTQQALVQLKLLEEDFRFKFRSLLEGYLRLLSEAPMAVAGAGVDAAGLRTVPDAGQAGAPAAAPAAPEPTPSPAEPLAAPAAPPMAAAEPRPVQRLEDDTPTEESTLAAAEAAALARAHATPEAAHETAAETQEQAVTAETAPAQEKPVGAEAEEAEPLRGFFFGRQMDDVDDTFPGEDGIRKDKTRDFEW